MDKRQIVGPAQQRRRYHLITAQEETDPLRFHQHQHQHQHQQQQEMPRLGGDEDGPRREAEAYANLNRPSNPFNLRTIVMILAVTFILRNLMFTDYRDKEITSLRASGKSQDEIDAIVPKTSSEIRKEYQNRKVSIVDMKHDIAFLMAEVVELRKIVGGNSTLVAAKGAVGSGSETETVSANAPGSLESRIENMPVVDPDVKE